MDKETGLYNYDARLYDPVVGRFISADTIVPEVDVSHSFDRYAYCFNNPLKYKDPSGHLLGAPNEDMGYLSDDIEGNYKEVHSINSLVDIGFGFVPSQNASSDIVTGLDLGTYTEVAYGPFGGLNLTALSVDLGASKNTPEQLQGPGTIAGGASEVLGVDISQSLNGSATSFGISVGLSFGAPFSGYGFGSFTDIDMGEE